MSKKIITASFVIASVMFSGCATILGGGTTQKISINSATNMKGTMKYSDGTGTQHFTAPATLNVDRKSKDIILTSDNNEFHTKKVKSSINPWFFGNIITGGVLGSTTDSVGGAAWKYDDVVNIAKK